MNTIQEKFTRPPEPGSGAGSGGFWRNLEMIRPVAWGIATVIFIGLCCVCWFVVIPQDNTGLAVAPLAARIAVAFLPGTVLAAYVLLIGFVYADGKRRGMRYVLWTLLAIFVPYAVGIILYFIVRDPLPTPCPKCGTMAREGFTFCPHCGVELLRSCRVCHKKIELGWTNCAYCGAPIGGQTAKAS